MKYRIVQRSDERYFSSSEKWRPGKFGLERDFSSRFEPVTSASEVQCISGELGAGHFLSS